MYKDVPIETKILMKQITLRKRESGAYRIQEEGELASGMGQILLGGMLKFKVLKVIEKVLISQLSGG